VPKGIDGFLNQLSSSEDILVEAIRQKCIYKITHDETNPMHIKDQKMIYWTYMNKFYQECLVEDKEFTISCSRNVLKEIDAINPEHNLNTAVEKCYIDSFSYSGLQTQETTDKYLLCEKNSILDEDASLVESRLKAALPIIYVNENAFYGSWTYENVLEAMCANLKEKPSSCYSDINLFVRPNEGILGLSFGSLVIIIVIFGIVNILLVLYCKRVVQDKIEKKITSSEINDKISEIVQSYIALREVKK